MVVHILIVYADFSRCRARFSWWDFVTTASPRKFEISYHYTCSSPFWHCYKIDRKRHLFWLKRSIGLDKTPIFYLFYQNWPRFVFTFCNIIVAKGRYKCLLREEILVDNWQVLSQIRFLSNFLSLCFFGLVHFSGPHGRF